MKEPDMTDDVTLSADALRQFSLDASAMMNAIEASKREQSEANPERFNADPTSAIAILSAISNSAISSKLTLATSLTKQELKEIIEAAFSEQTLKAYHENYFRQHDHLQELLEKAGPLPTEKHDIDAALKKLIQPQIDFYTSRLSDLFDDHASRVVGLSEDAPELNVAQHTLRRLGAGNLNNIVLDVSNLLTLKCKEHDVVPSEDLKQLFTLLVTGHVSHKLTIPDYKQSIENKIDDLKGLLSAQMESEGIYENADRFLERIEEETNRRLAEIMRNRQ